MSDLLVSAARIVGVLAIFTVGFYLTKLAFGLIMRFGNYENRFLGRTVPIAIATMLSAIAFQQVWIADDIAKSAFGLSAIAPFGNKSGYELVFQDEFDGNTLDTSKWSTQFYWGRTHNTHYMTYFSRDVFQVSNGKLRIKAEKRQGSKPEYNGGVITSFESFGLRYGYFEIRAKLPKGKGLWPAFWLGPTSKDWPPEIDIVELLGHEPNKVYMTHHWKNASGKHKYRQTAYTGPDFSTNYHVFAAEWTPTEIVWYIDGIERYRSDRNVPQVPMYVLTALTIGGKWPGAPDRTTSFPAYMDIDFIRVFKKK